MGKLGAVAGFWSLFFAVAVALVGLGVISPILPLYMREFGASGVELGVVFALFSLARFLLSPFFGRISDRTGRKPLILLGLGLYAGVSLAYSMAQALWQVAIVRLLQGAASTLVTPLAQAYVADRVQPGREGRTLNLFYTAQFVGMGIGPILGGSLAEHFGLRAPFWAMFFLAVLAGLGVAFLVPKDTRPSRHTKEVRSWREILAQPEIWAIAAYMGTRGFWRQAFNAFWPILAAEKGLGETLIGTVLTLYFLGESVFQIPAGYLADRWPAVPQVLWGGVVAVMPLFLIPFVSGVWPAAVLSVVMGVASALGRGSLLVLRTRVGRTHGMGAVVGVQTAAFAAGQALGPTLAGAAQSLAGLTAPFFLSGALGLVGALAAAAVLARTGQTRLPARKRTG